MLSVEILLGSAWRCCHFKSLHAGGYAAALETVMSGAGCRNHAVCATMGCMRLHLRADAIHTSKDSVSSDYTRDMSVASEARPV